MSKMKRKRAAACNAASKTFGDEKIQALAYGAEQIFRRREVAGANLCCEQNFQRREDTCESP